LKEAQKAYFIAFEFEHRPLKSLLDAAQLSFRLALVACSLQRAPWMINVQRRFVIAFVWLI
jgi:hypothetical protein